MKTLKSILIPFLLAAGFHTTANAQKSVSQEDRFPITSATKLEVTGLSGFDIQIETSDTKDVYFSWEISGNEDDVHEIASESGVEFSENGSVARMNFVLNGGKPQQNNNNDQSWLKSLLTAKKTNQIYVNNSKSVKHIVKIVFPKSFVLSLDARYSSINGYGFENDISIENRAGNVDLENIIGNLTLKNNYGNIDLRNVSGNVSAEAKSGNMRLDDIGGNVSLAADYGKMRLRNVGGNVSSENKSGTLQLENIDGSVTHNGNYTSVTVKSVKGMVTMENRSGSLTAENIGGLKFLGDYAKIDVRNSKTTEGFTIEGKSITVNFYDIVAWVDFTGQYSKLTSNKSVGRMEIEFEKGTLDLTEHKGNLFFSSSYSELRAYELSADSVSVTIEKAKTMIEFENKPTFVDITTDYGTVDLRFDRGFDGSVELDANEGKIQNELKLNDTTTNSTDAVSTVKGISGSGKGTLKVKTKKGDIRIK